MLLTGLRRHLAPYLAITRETVAFNPASSHWLDATEIEQGLAAVRARRDPSLHFRHGGRARVAWCDGHVSAERRTFTFKSLLYEGNPDRAGLGWFGPHDDNGFFDLD